MAFSKDLPLNANQSYPIFTNSMTEQTLKYLPIEGLFELLLLSSRELLEAMDKKDDIGIKIKKKQMELLLKVIAEKQQPQHH
jgi:hypothetical protein